MLGLLKLLANHTNILEMAAVKLKMNKPSSFVCGKIERKWIEGAREAL